jgi:hypothetical protein
MLKNLNPADMTPMNRHSLQPVKILKPFNSKVDLKLQDWKKMTPGAGVDEAELFRISCWISLRIYSSVRFTFHFLRLTSF